MYRKLIVVCFLATFFSCSQPSTNILYYGDFRYKQLFIYDGSICGHIVFIENYKSNEPLNQENLESFAKYYSSVWQKSNISKRIDYVKFIDEEFSQKEDIDKFHIGSVYLKYEGDKIEIKQFYPKE